MVVNILSFVSALSIAVITVLLFTLTIKAMLSISISESLIPFFPALSVALSRRSICSSVKEIFLSSSLAPACFENFNFGALFCLNISSKMFGALYEAGINISMISTSEITISVLIDKELADKAVSAVHKAFFG
mgnify:CR=1 FL=1